MSGKASRNRGNQLERDLAIKLKHIFPDVKTSRNESRTMDAQKVDLCNTGVYNFQCKCSINQPNYHNFIALEMPDEGVNLVVHRKTEKAGKRFMTRGDYITMELDVFIEMLEKIDRYEKGVGKED